MTPDPVQSDTRVEGDFNVSQVWLDALSRGTCDEDAFLRAVQMLTRRSPEAAWDSLALLDQYYRRGKIPADVFKRVKSRLGSQLLGPALDVELSVPLRRQETPAPSPTVVPVPPPAPGGSSAPVSTPSAASAPPTAPPPTVPPTAVRSGASAPSREPAPIAAAPAATAPVKSPAAPSPAAASTATTPLRTAAPPPPAASAPAAFPPAGPSPAAAQPPAQADADSSPSIFLVTAARAAKAAKAAAAAPAPVSPGSLSGGRTVPIGVEPPAIPVLDPPDRPIDPHSDAREVAIGDVLRGRYVIKNVLGLGGTGTVFEAADRYRLDLPESGQRVAIKVLHSGTAGQSAVLTDLRREFQLLQSLSHPNIVRAHEYDRDGDTAFFTMEHLSGLSLENVLSAHREVVLSRSHALIVVRDVAAALEHAHSRGVVHGDLNPGNIFITNDGEIRVLDFGAAHTPSGTPTVAETAWDGTAYATPRYASWQLLNGERADARDDTYSLACILYVLLSGKHPFGDLNAAQARAQRVKPRRPPRLTGKQWRALRAALSFDRERRPSDIAAWLEPFHLPKPETHLPVLLALLKSSPASARTSGGVLLLAGAIAIVAAGWWASGHMDRVSQTADDAQSALAALWHEARDAVAGSPAQPPALAPAAEPAAAQPPPTALPQTSPRTSASEPSAGERRSRSRAPATAGSSAAAAAAAAQPSHARIELTADTVDVPPSDPAAHILVKRTGNLHADTSFTWWTESGTAKSGPDFMSVKAHEEHFEDGKALINLFVPVVADPMRKQPKSFYVVINDPSEGASLGKRTLTMVTILPSE